ncbi:RimJ/RimL family protein N-acetyltransferase [Bradyrhizobium sp. S3.2.6]|uniref:N-acetyltransferase domain-containing protein n=1 Tax=Bradyrhizobium japonicum TaxID=375 RepID=A0A1Y2JYG6_BRAJP|nr:GNAT family N-acetyltransferase [Bradyrhizobium japonicum]OSJ36675.1 hypothetical protein BSZ19_03120 [Bradyrhizobium japonicum]
MRIPLFREDTSLRYEAASPSDWNTQMITHQTKRLILVPMQREHEAELFTLHNDPLIQKAIFKNVPQTAKDVHKMLDMFLAQWRKNRFGVWMVYEKTNNIPRFIGRCGLCDYEDTNYLEQATALGEQAAGRGFGAEASRFAVTHALEHSTKEKIVAVIQHGNVRAARQAKKFGLRYVDDRWRDGKFYQYYELTREEWFSQPHHHLPG